MLQAVVLRPLPYPHPEPLVSVWAKNAPRNLECAALRRGAGRQRPPLGLAGAFAAGRLLQEALYQVKPFDPLVFSAVAAFFAVWPRSPASCPRRAPHASIRSTPCVPSNRRLTETFRPRNVPNRMFRPLAVCVTALLLTVPSFAANEAPDRAEIQRLIEGRHWAAAQPLLELALTANPNDAEAHYLLGFALINQNKGDTAVAPLERATTLAPTNSEYQRALGDAYGVSAQKAGLFSKLGLARKCKAAYDKAVELDPKNLDARASVMAFCIQAPGIVGGGIDKAYAQAEEIKKIDVTQGRAAFATIYLAEKKYPEALATLEEVVVDRPDDYEALYQIGRLAAITGERLDRGIATLRQCLALTPPKGQPPHAAAHWRIGNILEKKGDKPGAKAAYEAALARDPKFKEAIESLKKL